MNDAAAIWLVARVHAPDEGGVQTYVAQVARAYARGGRRVTVFAKSSAGPRRITEDDITLVDVGPGAQMMVYLRLAIAMIRAWMAGGRPCVIHACTWRAAIPALLFPRPLIVTVHGREVGRPSKGAFRLMRAVLARTTRIIAVSDATRRLLLARAPDLAARCAIAWNGVVLPVDERQEPANARPRVMTVCRLVSRKNVPAAVHAVANCRNEGVALDYAVIGRGPDEDAIRAALEAAGAAAGSELGITVMTGYVEDAELAEHHRTADIFLHPQIALEDGAEMEGFGISVADAMAHGIACIVGQDGGPGELVRDGVTGLVVDGRDPGAVRAALALLARDAVYRRRLAENGRLFARENFSWYRHCRLALEGLVADAVEEDGRQQEQLTPSLN
ncbi:glycosyl transferase group 1 [Sphingomonas sp. LH128]|uniref:Glycosyl transferase group 1 n=1 Tax=Novosphingobium resinovorum TaxID=158500 RepID=A0A031K4X8_9SPHN|nr:MULTISPECIES: glycosyltransferase family 4 protein [Sphingomonadaceae]EJU10383.1 glycosyl transferase group 1 [Sphingomonas sp. LH128]EZP84280.1 Glycosyl transferase group 1 [Novosphingobium resinovorum]